MSQADAQTFLDWIRDGGCAGWIESALGDEEQMKKIEQVYIDIKAAFGY